MKQFKKPSKGTLGCLILLVAAGMYVKLVAVPKFVKARAEGQLNACKSNFHIITGELNVYATDWGGQYPKSLQQLEPHYLKGIPDCPASGRPYTYIADMKPFSADGPPVPHYLIYCAGDSHALAGLSENSPSFDDFEQQVKPAPPAHLPQPTAP